MKTPLDQVKDSIRKWNLNRNNVEKALDYLNQGNCFEITEQMYEKWKKAELKETDHIHAYVGINDGKMEFYLIDSIADSNPEKIKLENIIQCKYAVGMNNFQDIPHFAAIEKKEGETITPLTGSERFLRWMLLRQPLLEEKATDWNVFQVICIPFSDMLNIFDQAKDKRAIVTFGITGEHPANPKDYHNNVELILWSDHFVSDERIEDVALPIPPYGPKHNKEHFQLLIASDAN